MNFLEICGILWLVSVGAGGLWVGLCLSVDWWKSRQPPPDHAELEALRKWAAPGIRRHLALLRRAEARDV